MGLDTFVRGALRNAQEDEVRQQRESALGKEDFLGGLSGSEVDVNRVPEEAQDEVLSRWLRERPELEDMMEAVGQ